MIKLSSVRMVSIEEATLTDPCRLLCISLSSVLSYAITTREQKCESQPRFQANCARRETPGRMQQKERARSGADDRLGLPKKKKITDNQRGYSRQQKTLFNVTNLKDAKRDATF